jgi:hypothetical protein
VKISFKLSDLLALSHTYQDEEYITFEIARLQNPDNFGHTHTAYVKKQVEAEVSTVEEPKPKSKTRKAKTAEIPSGELPF